MSFEDCIYKRGFIFTDKQIQLPLKNWVKESFNLNIKQKFILYHDPETPFAYACGGKKWVMFLGKAVDTKNWITDTKKICEELYGFYEKSQLAFYNHVDFLNGRYAIFYGDKMHAYVMNDATGMRSVYYLKTECAIASHYGLIADLFNVEAEPYFLKYSQIKEQKPWTLPGDMTPYKDVRLLIPNHELDIYQRTIRRFYPRGEHPDYSLKEISETISESIKKQLEILASKETLLIGITKGIDSKVTMAASRSVRDKCVYFSYADSKLKPAQPKQTSRDDQQYAKQICELYNLKFIPLDLNHVVDPNLLAVLKKNSYHQHITSVVECYLYDLPKGLHIRSNLIEIVRDLNFLYTYNPNLSNVDNIIRWMQYGPYKTPEIMQYIADYYERTELDKIFNYELLHMFYWEHRMAAWVNASVIVESDIAFDTYMLFNCRKLLEFGFCLPKLYRDLNFIPNQVINNLWPELNFSVFNSQDTLYDYFDVENEGNCRIKDNIILQCGNTNDVNRIPQIILEPRIYGMFFGFGDCFNKSGDWARASLNIKTKLFSTYHLQIHALPPRTNKLKAGYVDFVIELNGIKVYGKDVSYLVNRVNQCNIFFKAEKDIQKLTFKLECKKDIDNSSIGCNGVVDIKSVILKEDIIPYDDKVYVINTTNLCTKKFFREYLHAEQDYALNTAAIYLTGNKEDAYLENIVVNGQTVKEGGTLIVECDPNSIYKLYLGASESIDGISSVYSVIVSDGHKYQEKIFPVGESMECYCSIGSGKHNIFLNAPLGTSIKFETVRIKKMAQN